VAGILFAKILFAKTIAKFEVVLCTTGAEHD
jgi:hypothetical protein